MSVRTSMLYPGLLSSGCRLFFLTDMVFWQDEIERLLCPPSVRDIIAKTLERLDKDPSNPMLTAGTNEWKQKEAETGIPTTSKPNKVQREKSENIYYEQTRVKFSLSIVLVFVCG